MPGALPPSRAALERRLRIPEGTLEGEDAAAADEALADATALALAEVSEAVGEKWRTAAPDVVLVVVLKAARREFENPSGYSQEANGEHSASTTETSGVFLTGREIAQVRRAAIGRAGAFVGSISTPSAYGGNS